MEAKLYEIKKAETKVGRYQKSTQRSKTMSYKSTLDFMTRLLVLPHQWLLSTSELAQLLKVSPKTVRSYGEQFSDAGFVFTLSWNSEAGRSSLGD